MLRGILQGNVQQTSHVLWPTSQHNTQHTNEEMDVPLGSQPLKELTSASISFFIMATYHEWSQSYIKGLTFEEHHMNNEWFNNMLAMLKDDGELYVPMLNKSFNKLGEEVASWMKNL